MTQSPGGGYRNKQHREQCESVGLHKRGYTHHYPRQRRKGGVKRFVDCGELGQHQGDHGEYDEYRQRQDDCRVAQRFFHFLTELLLRFLLLGELATALFQLPCQLTRFYH